MTTNPWGTIRSALSDANDVYRRYLAGAFGHLSAPAEVLSAELDEIARKADDAIAQLSPTKDVERVEWVEANVCRMTRRFADGYECDIEWESNGPDADTFRSTVDAARNEVKP